ncbi:hypothetical protein [Nitrosopumilus ureiphilus]|uniref:hypothetical protein n=1 Tax=Nitrosopumilus ureiphilus TaxID=1470067 RepID=UPI0015C905BC|nr:hypothetical protein [Nitrosopumilus ureiphilus]
MKNNSLLIALIVIVIVGVHWADAYHDDRTSRSSSDPRITAVEDDAFLEYDGNKYHSFFAYLN